jgi:hypothetical protein
MQALTGKYFGLPLPLFVGSAFALLEFSGTCFVAAQPWIFFGSKPTSLFI